LTGLAHLALAAAAFVGTHFLLSHPLRASLIRRVGPKAFEGVYSVVALVTFGWMVWVYRALGEQQPLWAAGDVLWWVGTLLMWFASMLFVGSLVGNPALPGAPAAATPRGALAITRHPMMWSFAIWAAVHLAVVATPKALLLDLAILVLTIGGSVGQDAKKRKLMGERWHEWTAQTAFIPYSRGLAYPGTVAVIGGTLLFVLVTWAHPMPAGFWRLAG
jgi:uncharacterized membrane protein